ncbi:hypothetical protein WR25_11169, partial [Diploscapter pachys]
RGDAEGVRSTYRPILPLGCERWRAASPRARPLRVFASSRESLSSASLHRRAGGGVDARLHRHAGAQALDQLLAGIDADADGDALRHLGEVARRIVGLQHREFGSGGGRDALDAAGELRAAEAVDGEGRGLAHRHARGLRFLEIGDDPGFGRHQEHQL